MRDFGDYVLGGIVVLLILLVGVCIYAVYQENEACEAKGGEMVGDGTYTTTTTFITTGNVTVPVVNSFENTVCTK